MLFLGSNLGKNLIQGTLFCSYRDAVVNEKACQYRAAHEPEQIGHWVVLNQHPQRGPQSPTHIKGYSRSF